MSQENKRRPILGKGEIYSKPVVKQIGGPRKEPAASYAEAKQNILSGIQLTKDKFEKLPASRKLPHEFVMCVRLDPDFSAKSYYPDSLFDFGASKFGLEEVGSRLWRKSKTDVGKLFFVRATNESLDKLERHLNEPEENLTKSFKMDVRKVTSIDILEPEEQILGVPKDWKEGRLEAVLHPFSRDNKLTLNHFLDLLKEQGVDLSRIRHKQYEGGVTFVSLFGDRELLNSLAGYNPLRNIHPLNARDLIVSRGTSASNPPQPPVFSRKPEVVMGVFDGGINPDNPYLKNYAENIDLVKGASYPGGIDHGTQVTGAALYGPLNNYAPTAVLPEPPITVKSFRVLSDANQVDPELYEIIDAIEEEVPKNKEIKVYNLSLGPKGPILDDHITRFTFAIDLLSAKHGILFCNAVGNDGHKGAGYDRIQAPSDSVNGLGVGSYTKKNGKVEKAFYSSIGPGREGNKLKPDLLAFGGCDHTPIHLLSNTSGEKILNLGTSFASPIVASYAAQLVGYGEKAINPLVARAMLIHAAISDKKDGHSNDFGHGILPDTLEEVVTCVNNSYTLIYQGELDPGKYAEFRIPWIPEVNKGKVNFRWTLAILTGVDPQSPDDYTTSSAVLTFYPNSHKFQFSKKEDGKKITQLVDITAEPDKAKLLIKQGWEKDSFPKSAVGPAPYAPEEELRADLKWDSTDCRCITKNSSSVKDPVFHLHALTRGKRNLLRKVKYALILSVEATDDTVDLYSKVLNQFTALVPIKLQIEAQARAEVQ